MMRVGVVVAAALMLFAPQAFAQDDNQVVFGQYYRCNQGQEARADELAEEVFDPVMQKHIDEHDVKVRTRYQAGLPTLHGDPARLRRAFCNLLLNGIQASEGIEGRRPELTVSTHLELAPDRPKIRVSIPPSCSAICRTIGT